MRLSIATVNFWSLDWIQLSLKKLKENTAGEYEVILVDNSGELKQEDFDKNVRVIKLEAGLNHGQGLDVAVKEATGKYIMTLDADAHILMKDWDNRIISWFEKQDNIDLITCQGGMFSPARPCGMFFEKEFFVKNKMSFEVKDCDGVMFDVGVHFYFRTMNVRRTEGYVNNVALFPVKENPKTDFKDVLGSEHLWQNERFIYHNWFGSRWYGKDGQKGKRRFNKLGKVTFEEFEVFKSNLFKQVNDEDETEI